MPGRSTGPGILQKGTSLFVKPTYLVGVWKNALCIKISGIVRGNRNEKVFIASVYTQQA